MIQAARWDGRWFQIFAQLLLLLLGVLFLDFGVTPIQVFFTFASALFTQWMFLRILGLRSIGYKSPIVTAFGLSLLLRANAPWVHPLAAFVAIASKFVLRFRKEHLFNPANLGVVFALLCLPGTWVSPGQWGQNIVLAAWMLALGGLVVRRVGRSDIALFFLGFHLGFFAIRLLWLGQSFELWFHRFQDGSLLLFSFFMISDPKTIPYARGARILHAFLVAAIAYAWQFDLYRTNALIWALFFASFGVPLWNKIWLSNPFQWNKMAPKEIS